MRGEEVCWSIKDRWDLKRRGLKAFQQVTRGRGGRGNRIKCSEMKEVWCIEMLFSYLTKKLLTTDKKAEKFVRLELSIQACLDVMQNRQRKKHHHRLLIKRVT